MNYNFLKTEIQNKFERSVFITKFSYKMIIYNTLIRKLNNLDKLEIISNPNGTISLCKFLYNDFSKYRKIIDSQG